MSRDEDQPTYLPSPEEIEAKKAEIKAANMERMKTSQAYGGERSRHYEPVKQYRNAKLPPL